MTIENLFFNFVVVFMLMATVIVYLLWRYADQLKKVRRRSDYTHDQVIGWNEFTAKLNRRVEKLEKESVSLKQSLDKLHELLLQAADFPEKDEIGALKQEVANFNDRIIKTNETLATRILKTEAFIEEVKKQATHIRTAREELMTRLQAREAR